MITFNYETEFILDKKEQIAQWVEAVIRYEGCKLGEVNYIFCDDESLHKINVEFLQHDNYTDIISFDYTLGKMVNGDIYISVDRVKENSIKYNTTFADELHRVMIHGILHYVGYKDKTEGEQKEMRNKENEALGQLK